MAMDFRCSMSIGNRDAQASYNVRGVDLVAKKGDKPQHGGTNLQVRLHEGQCLPGKDFMCPKRAETHYERYVMWPCHGMSKLSKRKTYSKFVEVSIYPPFLW